MLGKIISAILGIIIIGVLMAIYWICTCGVLYLIALCFGLAFSWKIATGIWLCLLLLSSVFKSSDKSKK